MKKSRLLCLLVVFALLIGPLSTMVPASAGSAWEFRTKSGKVVLVNDTIAMNKNEFQDFNLYKSGKEVKEKDSRYDVTWSSDNKDVVWIDAKNGKARADKFGKLTNQYYEATVTAKIKNRTTGAIAYRRFKVSVGTPLPVVDRIVVNIKNITDYTQVLQMDSTYQLETVAYDTKGNLMSEKDAKLYYAYFADKEGLSFVNNTFVAKKDGEYIITAAAFETEAEAKKATSPEGALFKDDLPSIIVEAKKPKILECRQVNHTTVALTFNFPEYATLLEMDPSLLNVSYEVNGDRYNCDFVEVLVEEGKPNVALINLFNGLTEGVLYTFNVKTEAPAVATVRGSGTRPARISFVQEAVEVDHKYTFKVKIYNNAGVDITDVSSYACTFESIDPETSRQYIMEGNTIYFFKEGMRATIKATLDPGYDLNGYPLPPLTDTMQFTSIPQAKPTYGTCNGFVVTRQTDAPQSLNYTTNKQTICIGDGLDKEEKPFFLYATIPYTDEFRETKPHHIAGGLDLDGGSGIYTYKSSDEFVLSVASSSGQLYPFSKGEALIYIYDESSGTPRNVGAARITVSEERTLTSFTISEQSSTKLSATGNSTGVEVVTMKLNPKDQLGEKANVNYRISLPNPNDPAFESAFQYEIKDNILRIWEGNGLTNIVTTKNTMRTFSIQVTATDAKTNKSISQGFNLTVKNVTNAQVTEPKLLISQKNIDMKLDRDSVEAYDSVIQVVTTDVNGYFIRNENLQQIPNADAASTVQGEYSVLITKGSTGGNDVSIKTVGNTIVLSPVWEQGDLIQKAQTGTYTIRLYRGLGDSARPVGQEFITLTDSTAPLTVSIKEKKISDINNGTIERSIYVKRSGVDISSKVNILDMTLRQVNDTCQISQLVLEIKATELNPDWPSNKKTTVVVKGLNLQFKLQ